MYSYYVSSVMRYHDNYYSFHLLYLSCVTSTLPSPLDMLPHLIIKTEMSQVSIALRSGQEVLCPVPLPQKLLSAADLYHLDPREMFLHISYTMFPAQKVIASERHAGRWVVPLPTLKTNMALDFAGDFTDGNAQVSKS